jgi:hypothetical protein
MLWHDDDPAGYDRQAGRLSPVDIGAKIEVLKEVTVDTEQFGRVLDKLLEATLSQQRLQLARYDRDLGEFEHRYSLDSDTFYQKFQSGELGDDIDYFEWAGLHELRHIVIEKIHRLEQAL